MSYLKPCPSCGGPIYSEIVEELARLRDALSAKDREIAELRQRTIGNCEIEAIARVLATQYWGRLSSTDSGFAKMKYPDGLVQYVDERWPLYADDALAALTAIRSLGKEGSGDQ